MIRQRIGAAVAIFMMGTALMGTACVGNEITESNVVGTWTVDFEWAGRTPGVLSLVVTPNLACQQLAGPGVGATTGTISVANNDIKWVMEDGTSWSGTGTSSTTMSGSMTSSSGNTGTFNATKASD
jgi:hypothetical protein